MLYRIIFWIGVISIIAILIATIIFLVVWVPRAFIWIKHQGWKVHSCEMFNDPDYHAFGIVYYKDGQDYPSGWPKYYRTFEDALLDKYPIDG